MGLLVPINLSVDPELDIKGFLVSRLAIGKLKNLKIRQSYDDSALPGF